MVIMVDFIQLFSSHVYTFANQCKFSNLIKTTYNHILENNKFIPSKESNHIISHGTDGNNGSNSPTNKPTTSSSGGAQQNNNPTTHGGNNTSSAGSSGDGGDGDGNGNGNDEHKDDYHGEKKDKKKGNKKRKDDHETEEDEKTVELSKLDVHAPTFTPKRDHSRKISMSDTNRLDPIEEDDDSMGPGSVAISTVLTTKIIPDIIEEKIRNPYWFMNKSLCLQQNKFTTEDNIGIINYDFTDKNNERLYCVIEPQEMTSRQQHKWRMVDKLFKKSEIIQEFKIPEQKLPKSFRQDDKFLQGMNSMNDVKKQVQIEATKSILNKTKWTKIPIIKRKNNKQKITLSITKNEFQKKLRAFCTNKGNECVQLIPILIFDQNNSYHIEYIWVVNLNNGNDIGISIKYVSGNQRAKITGIYVDKQFILNQHQLVSPQHASTCRCLDTFESNINDLHIGNVNEQQNQNKQLKKENKALRYRIVELENKTKKANMQDCAIQADTLSVPQIEIPCDDQNYAFYKSKLCQCKELIKQLANKVHEKELKMKAQNLLNSPMTPFSSDKDSIINDECSNLRNSYLFSNQHSKNSDNDHDEMEDKKDDDEKSDINIPSPTSGIEEKINESAQDIRVTLFNNPTSKISLHNPTSLFVSTSQLSSITDTNETNIANKTNMTTQSAPNPGLGVQFLDPVHDQAFILSRPGSATVHHFDVFPYYMPITAPIPLFDPYFHPPPPPPQWHPTIYNQLLTQQVIPSMPHIVGFATNETMPVALPTLPTKANLFVPTNKMNVFIHKCITTNALLQIDETFRNSQMLYYYLSHTINMQIYNQCAKQFDDGCIIVNLDLCAQTTNKLYAIIKKNDAVSKGKYEWKLDQLSEDIAVVNKYHISKCELPISFRTVLQLFIDRQFVLSALNNMKLKFLYIIKNKSPCDNQAAKLRIVSMTIEDLRKCIRDSIDKQTEFIPILNFKDTKYWAEFLLICETPHKMFNFGVAFKWQDSSIQPTAIFLDELDIERQNMLTGNRIASHILNNFKSGLKYINIIEH